LERRGKRQFAQGLPLLYDRAALKLTAEERQDLETAGRAPHWRFLLEDRTVAWDDLVRGRQTIEASSLSDPVLVRADGTYLDTLPSVVNDVEFHVTHVIRGEDHVANTGVQIQLFEALGAAPPAFALALYKSLNALASLFDFDKLSCAPARFDINELKSNNARLLQKLDYSEVAGRLAAAAIGGGEAFWNAVRGNLRIFDDVKHWWPS
jgi:glutamyl-tRNA synthetase